AQHAQARKLFQPSTVSRWHDDLFEAERLGFTRAHWCLSRAANFAGQTNFAEDSGVSIDRLIAKTSSDRRDKTEIDCRLIDVQSAGDVHEYVVAEQLHAGALLE